MGSLKKDLAALEEWFRTGGGSRAERDRRVRNLRLTFDPFSAEEVGEIIADNWRHDSNPDEEFELHDATATWASRGGDEAWNDLAGMGEVIRQEIQAMDLSLLSDLGLEGERGERGFATR